jgi:hypothetical protein
MWATATEKKTGLRFGPVRSYGLFRSYGLDLETLFKIYQFKKFIAHLSPTHHPPIACSSPTHHLLYASYFPKGDMRITPVVV